MRFLTIKNLTFYCYEAGLENCCEKPSFIFVHPHVIIVFQAFLFCLRYMICFLVQINMDGWKLH